MRWARYLGIGIFAAALALGCSGNAASLIKARGRVVKNGSAYTLPKGRGLRINFAPQAPPEGNRYDSYPAIFDPDKGTFEVVGKNDQGLPPGKYKVSLELMEKKEDLFNGKLTGNASPIVLEVTPANPELVIDFDAFKLDELLKQSAKTKAAR